MKNPLQSPPSVLNYLHFGHSIWRSALPRLRHNLPQETSQLRKPSMTILSFPYPLNLCVEVRHLILKAPDTDPHVKLKEELINAQLLLSNAGCSSYSTQKSWEIGNLPSYYNTCSSYLEKKPARQTDPSFVNCFSSSSIYC